MLTIIQGFLLIVLGAGIGIFAVAIVQAGSRADEDLKKIKEKNKKL